MTDYSSELLKGSFITLLLAVLAQTGDAYGYEIAKRLSEETEGRISPGQSTLYPALHAMENKGFVEAYWGKVSGRQRKYYALTSSGRAELTRRRAEWSIFQKTLNAVLNPG